MENITLRKIPNGDEYSDYMQYYTYFYEEQNRNSFMDISVLPATIILCIVIILSLIGNTLVVVISVFYMRLRSVTCIFILNLALSDLLFTVGLPFWVCGYIWGWTFREATCKVIHFVFSAGFYSSMVFLVLMSIQRYMAVVHPLSRWKKGRCFTCIVVCAWVVSILAALPDTVHTVAYPESGGCMYSSVTALVAIQYEYIIVFVCAFLVMAFCYIRILQTIFKSLTNRRHRTTGLAFFLVATFFICWAPYNIMNFLMTLTELQNLKYIYAFYICTLLASTQCCLYPVIYGLFGLKFRKSAWEIFQRRATLNSEQIGIGERQSDSCV
ncbi:chemokine XC receptor 1 [Ictalurus punctatus]|uniref:Chemokine XC receptor 1 n=1 Tax=Ictalurus punctatus TaxID=7998 RepID=A0A2D0SHB6_ICTPU|nr:chemokine XC receptor 1 [Ictalurus punctatus]